jgi:hypothetical protein
MSSQYGQRTPICSKRWWFETTWKNIVQRHDPSMVSDNKVFKFWYSCNFKKIVCYMFLSCFCHVFYKLLLNFPIYFPFPNIFYIMSCLWCYFFFQLHITSFYSFIIYISNTLIFCYPLSFVTHGLYGFDKKKYHVITMFQKFQNLFIKFFFHIPRTCSRWFFESIQ